MGAKLKTITGNLILYIHFWFNLNFGVPCCLREGQMLQYDFTYWQSKCCTSKNIGKSKMMSMFIVVSLLGEGFWMGVSGVKVEN